MQNILSPHGQTCLAATLGTRPLLAFDFDGTLAPIVARPEQARMAPGVAGRLKALAERLPVAIVTGRRVADVRPRLGFEPRYIVGSHGAENALGVDASAWQPALQAAREWLNGHRAEWARLGIQMEDKVNSIALHYRLAPDRELAARRLEEILRTAGPALRVFGGKRVYNVVAALAPDKADAVHALVEDAQCSAAMFVGDDINDEPVFARAPAHWLTLRVGRTAAHSSARFCLGSPSEMGLLLDRMLSLLDAQGLPSSAPGR
jgi:trehalose 6-phosphate phosphatase